jgi:hypothetical protein
MSGQYRLNKEGNKSRFYILLSIIFVGVMIKWGIPFMIDTISGPQKSPSIMGEKDIIPPQQPIFSALPEATNSADLSIEGFTEPDAFVELMVNEVASGTIRANESGLFKFNVSLKQGDNNIQVSAEDLSGNKSQSVVARVMYDNSALELTVDSPKDGSEYFGRANQTVNVTGKVNKEGCEVLVNNSFALVDKSGSFAYRLMLSDGENTVKVIAIDKAGNRDELELKLKFNP